MIEQAMHDKLELYIAAADGDVESVTAAWLAYYTKAKSEAGAMTAGSSYNKQGGPKSQGFNLHYFIKGKENDPICVRGRHNNNKESSSHYISSYGVMVNKKTKKVTSAGRSKSITVGTAVEKDTCVGDACPYRPKRKGAKRNRKPTPSSSPPSTPQTKSRSPPSSFITPSTSTPVDRRSGPKARRLSFSAVASAPTTSSPISSPPSSPPSSPTLPVSAPVPVEPAAPPAALLRMQELLSALDHHFAIGDPSQASLTLWLTTLLTHPTLSAMDFIFQLRSMQ